MPGLLTVGVAYIRRITSLGGVTLDAANTTSGLQGIVKRGRVTGQTAAVASIAAYTVGAVDASFLVSTTINVTAGATFSFNTQVTYTDETNTTRTVNLINVFTTGASGATVSNAAGNGPYSGIPHLIRAKAGTTITTLTSAAGTYTSVTFNAESVIAQTS